MKKLTRLVFFSFAVFLCTKFVIPNLNLDTSAILESILQKIDTEEIQVIAEKGIEALTEQFPQLKLFLSSEGMTDLLTGQGLEMLQEFASGNSSLTQTQADTLGTLLEVMSPELSDVVDSILNDSSNLTDLLTNIS